MPSPRCPLLKVHPNPSPGHTFWTLALAASSLRMYMQAQTNVSFHHQTHPGRLLLIPSFHLPSPSSYFVSCSQLFSAHKIILSAPPSPPSSPLLPAAGKQPGVYRAPRASARCDRASKSGGWTIARPKIYGRKSAQLGLAEPANQVWSNPAPASPQLTDPRHAQSMTIVRIKFACNST